MLESHPLSADFEPVRRALREANWLGVEEGLSWGTPALKVRGKMLVRIREPGVIVVMCDFEEKKVLTQTQPDVYFETDHYKGYPAVLVRLSVTGFDELVDLIDRSWRTMATPRMIAELDASKPAK